MKLPHEIWVMVVVIVRRRWKRAGKALGRQQELLERLNSALETVYQLKWELRHLPQGIRRECGEHVRRAQVIAENELVAVEERNLALEEDVVAYTNLRLAFKKGGWDIEKF